MADYYVIYGDETGKKYTVAFHIPVPNENNKANASNLRDALSQDSTIDKQTKIPWLDDLTQTKIKRGEIFEHIEVFEPTEGDTFAQSRAKIDARFLTLKTAIQNKLRERYAFWRYERVVS